MPAMKMLARSREVEDGEERGEHDGADDIPAMTPSVRLSVA